METRWVEVGEEGANKTGDESVCVRVSVCVWDTKLYNLILLLLEIKCHHQWAAELCWLHLLQIFFNLLPLLVQALVISHLDYYNVLLTGLPACAIRPPQIVQNTHHTTHHCSCKCSGSSPPRSALSPFCALPGKRHQDGPVSLYNSVGWFG